MLDGVTSNGMMAYSCARCGLNQPAVAEIDSRGCPQCHQDAPSNFEITYTREALVERKWPEHRPSEGLWRYDKFLPVAKEKECLSLFQP